MTHVYEKDRLPLKKARFRVFSSTVLTMVLYDSYDACIEVRWNETVGFIFCSLVLTACQACG